MAVAEWGHMTPEDKVAFGNQVKKEEQQASSPHSFPSSTFLFPNVLCLRWHRLLALFWLDSGVYRNTVQSLLPQGEDLFSQQHCS